MGWSKLVELGVGQPAGRWEGQKGELPVSVCGTKKWAVCCDGQEGAAAAAAAAVPPGSAGIVEGVKMSVKNI